MVFANSEGQKTSIYIDDLLTVLWRTERHRRRWRDEKGDVNALTKKQVAVIYAVIGD